MMHEKIGPQHLGRKAILYVQQSSLRVSKDGAAFTLTIGVCQRVKLMLLSGIWGPAHGSALVAAKTAASARWRRNA